MKIEILTKDLIEPLTIGGCILGGGGGGSIKEGRNNAEYAFEIGAPKFISIDDFEDEDTVINVSAVGAPAAPDQHVEASDYAKTIEVIQTFTGIKPKAIMTNENGGHASVNGIIQSALLGIPILDAACNGRAHPTGVMGSIRLTEVEGYESVQACLGGRPGTDTRIEMVVKGNIANSAQMVRKAAVQAGGLVTVARNPVSARYAKENAAIGAISHAIEVGRANMSGDTPKDKVNNVVDLLGGRILAEGQVSCLDLKTINGFDLGKLLVDTPGDLLELTFWNEYMTAETSGDRISTFPDLIMTFSAETGLPVTSAELKEKDQIVVITVPYENILLGSGMFVESNYHIVEEVLGKDIISYHKSLFKKGRWVQL